jgi:PhzF family phenazine biosynthesis protein
MRHRFHQVDVFSATPLRGNPLAVVHDAGALDDDRMAALARWTNLSETTFLLPPTDAAADYRVRIFTPFGELPFAGHPTLGSAWAWRAAGGRPRTPGRIVQQCGVGLVELRADSDRLAFAAPPLRRSGPLPAEVVDQACAALGLAPAEVQAHQWVDNGPGWAALLLDSAARVRALRPDWPALGLLKLGVVGPCAASDAALPKSTASDAALREVTASDAAPPEVAAGDAPHFEVRAFIGSAQPIEDPVTGSLNAGLAQWLIGAGLAPERYVAAQGSALQRAGRLHLWRDGATVWVGGDVVPVIDGEIAL